MDAQLIEYIRQLSKSDTKTLSQKLGKTTEELGELARAILPYDNAFATTHRFVDRENILEECADLILCEMSIAFDLGFTYEELIAMIFFKAGKWQWLQQKSGRVNYPVPFEMHVTIESGDVETFKADCAEIGVKPLMLALHNSTGGVFNDLQTSSKHLGTNRTAYEEVNRIADALTAKGYRVVRKKIETVPWHPMAPSQIDEKPKMPKDCYFECHFGVNLHEDGLDKFRAMVGQIKGVHTSRNVFKKLEGGIVKIMLTVRAYEGTYEAFQAHVETMHALLGGFSTKLGDFAVDKPIIEFSVFDTKISHDAEWLK